MNLVRIRYSDPFQTNEELGFLTKSSRTIRTIKENKKYVFVLIKGVDPPQKEITLYIYTSLKSVGKTLKKHEKTPNPNRFSILRVNTFPFTWSLLGRLNIEGLAETNFVGLFSCSPNEAPSCSDLGAKLGTINVS